ncbi:hypothetical protein CHUAL_007452 [Chamberlinius hualienensis]
MTKNCAHLGVVILAAIVCVVQTQDTSVLTATTSCTPDDFVAGASCTLTCTSPSVPENWSWQYYGNSETSIVYIFDNTAFNVTGDGYTTSLKLTTYNAGNYRCLFNLKAYNMYYNFKIDAGAKGVNLNDVCTESTECLALDAICNDQTSASGTCHCPDNYIPYDSNANTPSCLKKQEPDANCNTDAQCSKTNESYECVNYLCTCTGEYQNIKSQGNKLMCIAPIYLMDECHFDEECLLTADHSYCSDIQICDCSNGYCMDMSGGHKEDYFCYAESSITPTICTPENIEKDGGCSISCLLPPPTDNETLIDYKWQYYGNDAETIVEIFDDISFNATEEGCNLYLKLTSYNQGNYRCLFNFEVVDPPAPKQYYCDIQIVDATEDGIYLEENCTTSTDCLALDAACVDDTNANGTCHCTADYVPYSSKNDTPACLAKVAPEGSCNIDAQCSRTNESYACQTNICNCTGTFEKIKSQNDKSMCIASVYLMDECHFDEECLLTAADSYCSSTGMCDCHSGDMDMSTKKKEDYFCIVDNGLSPGAIAGIVIGSVAGVAIIGGIIFYFVQKSD